MKITAPYTLFESATFKPLTSILLLANTERHWVNGIVTAIITDLSLVDVPTVLAWVSAGGSVEEFPTFLEMTDAAYGGNVPVGIPNAEDENGNVRKWSDWKDANHEHVVINGKNYVPSNSFGTNLTGEELTLVDGLTGINILTSAEYKALLPNDPEE